MTKREIAIALSTTSNVMANKYELVQFFDSYNFKEKEIGSIIEDFIEWRDSLDNTYDMEEFIKSITPKNYSPSKIPKKILLELKKQQDELEEYIKNYKYGEDL